MPKKSPYTLLFEKLYDYYVNNGDNNVVWANIFKDTKDFVGKLMHKSPLLKQLHSECKQEVLIALMNSFRTYDPSRGASLHTWATRLCGQAIWAFIKEKVEKVDNAYIVEMTSIDASDEEDPETLIIKQEEIERQNKVKERLTKALGGPIEVEVFAMMNGLFGYQEMKIKDIADEMRFSVKTIYDINVRNNRKLRELRKDEDKIDELLK